MAFKSLKVVQGLSPVSPSGLLRNLSLYSFEGFNNSKTLKTFEKQNEIWPWAPAQLFKDVFKSLKSFKGSKSFKRLKTLKTLETFQQKTEIWPWAPTPFVSKLFFLYIKGVKRFVFLKQFVKV